MSLFPCGTNEQHSYGCPFTCADDHARSGSTPADSQIKGGFLFAASLICGIVTPTGLAGEAPAPYEILAAAPGLTQAAVVGDSGEFEELLFEAQLNGLPPSVNLFAVRDDAGRLWVPADNFTFWKMHPPIAAMTYHGRDLRRLDNQPGLSYTVDPGTMMLAIDAEPQWFEGNRVDTDINKRGLTPRVDPGGFLNYDLSVATSNSEVLTGGLFEAGVFSGWGVATTTFAYRNGGPEDGLVRLDTTWTRDLPDRKASLRVGDAIGTGGAWGRPVRFGGVQFATNFATQPGFITFPLPRLQGEAALPSTLDLYVNGMRRMHSEVPVGPFSIPDLPSVTGRGEVTLVVRDVLGREQIITDTFYSSSRLLREGLHEFSYELGSERESYGLESFDYGRNFAAGTHRLGINDRFTAEARAELSSGQYTAGVGGAFLIGDFGVINGSVAGSHSERGEGGQVTIGLEHASKWLGVGFNLQLASEDFAQLGLLDDELAPRMLGQAWVSVPLQRAGALSLSYVERDDRSRPGFRTLSASYQVSIGDIGFLSLFATRFEGEEDDTLFGFTFTRPFRGHTTSSSSGSFGSGGNNLLFNVQRNLPAGSGYGYRARMGLLDRELLDLAVVAQNDHGTALLEVSHTDDETGVRAGVKGGIAYLADSVHFSREITESFAVVRVGEFDGVRIYADNQHVATSDEEGLALLPRLRAYEENPLDIDATNLPLNVRIGDLDQRVVPYFRSGVVVDFEITRIRSAIFHLHRADGQPVPAGTVIIGPGKERFPVGFEGESYVFDVVSGTRMSAHWNGTECEFDLDLPEDEDAFLDLGIVTCTESKQ